MLNLFSIINKEKSLANDRISTLELELSELREDIKQKEFESNNVESDLQQVREQQQLSTGLFNALVHLSKSLESLLSILTSLTTAHSKEKDTAIEAANESISTNNRTQQLVKTLHSVNLTICRTVKNVGALTP